MWVPFGIWNQWWANLKSLSCIKISNLIFSNSKSHGPNPNPKSQSQSSKCLSNSHIPIFPQVHKHELRSVQQRRELAICQCRRCLCMTVIVAWLTLMHRMTALRTGSVTSLWWMYVCLTVGKRCLYGCAWYELATTACVRRLAVA